MPNLYASKRAHALHRCENAIAFRQAFEQQIGRSVEDLIDSVLPRETRRAILLTGSLAEGIGSAVSDIDLMVVIGREDIAHIAPSGPATVKSTATGGLELAIIDCVLEGLEVDIALVSGPRLGRICAALGRGGVALGEEDIRVLARLKRGWVLDDASGYLAAFPGLRDRLSLEIYCATTYYSLALKRLEDAFAAARKDPALSLHLGRLCVEQVIFAWLASKGTCYPGAKWIAHVRKHEGVDHGLTLLFPTLSDEAIEIGRYLIEVQRFADEIRSLIEQNRAFRIAFDFCPQIYTPDFDIAS